MGRQHQGPMSTRRRSRKPESAGASSRPARAARRDAQAQCKAELTKGKSQGLPSEVRLQAEPRQQSEQRQRPRARQGPRSEEQQREREEERKRHEEAAAREREEARQEQPAGGNGDPRAGRSSRKAGDGAGPSKSEKHPSGCERFVKSEEAKIKERRKRTDRTCPGREEKQRARSERQQRREERARQERAHEESTRPEDDRKEHPRQTRFWFEPPPPSAQLAGTFEKWEIRCMQFLMDKKRDFPHPPHLGCRDAQCQRQIQDDEFPLRTCKHSMKRLFRLNPERGPTFVRRFRLLWHPDRFSADGIRGTAKQKAGEEIFKILSEELG